MKLHIAVFSGSKYIAAKISKCKSPQAQVVHISNPSYSGGRDQEDRSLKPALGNSALDPVLKKKKYEKGWWRGFLLLLLFVLFFVFVFCLFFTCLYLTRF
jgi:hypothetical protein